jgi:Ca2+-binding RTX toxin-like protein
MRRGFGSVPTSVPVFDRLESRICLSGWAWEAAWVAVLRIDPVATPAKKDDGGGEGNGGDGRKKKVKTPEVTVLLNGASLADGSASVDFGRVTSGGAAALRTFVIRNDGTKVLEVKDLALPAGFALLDAPAGRLDAGDSTSFAVRMDSGGAVGGRAGRLSFRTNDADEGTFDFAIHGTVSARPAPKPPPVAGAPMVTVRLVRRRRSSLGMADGASTAIDFAPGVIGGARPTRTFRVASEGGATLRLGAVQLPAGFRLIEPLSATLAPGTSDEFTVGLDTSSVGSKRGRISFSTNDARVPAFDFAVVGSISAAAPTPTPVPTPRPTTQPTTTLTRPPASAALSGSTLVIQGTSAADVIVLSGRSSALGVTINGTTRGPFSGVSKVIVNAGSGNDSVNLSRLFLNATANGGPGNDTLTGTQADDVLNGESGDDVLAGGPGDDHLLGGDGDDTLTGGPGLDVFHGEDGADVLDALDGVADSVLDGGGGADAVKRDRVDPAAT